jgi:site-specific DNA-methyltransferase (adenine-specific)
MIDLRLGDSLKLMKAMPSESIDIVVTSPPYNLGNDHHTDTYRHHPYDDDLPEVDYQAWQIEVLGEIFRLLKPAGWLFYNHKNRIKNARMISPLEWVFKTPFILRQEVVWYAGCPNMDPCRFYPFTERIYCLAKSDASQMENVLKLTDDWHIPPVGTRGEHARAFPEKIPSRLIASVSGDLVLDPYMGSGTTGVACIKLNRSFIGIELSPEYYAVAERRIQNSQLQMRLL